MKNKLSGQFTFRSLLSFALPTIIMMVFMSLYGMVDGIFVSRLISTSALSAVNIVYPLVSIVIAVGIMLATGASAVVAKKMGEGGIKEAREDFTVTVLIGVAFGVLITAAGLFFLDPLLIFLGANEAIFDLCRDYAFSMLLFTIPAILQMLFQTFFVTAGRPGTGLFLVVLGGIANIVLDYIFIGRLDWGIRGAAIATGIGYCIPGFIGLLWFAFHRKGTLYFVAPVLRFHVLLHTLTNGSSEMVTNLSTAIITYLFNIMMMKYLGEDGVAAITIVLYAEFLLIAVYLGFSSGIAPILSYNHGEQNTLQLKRLFKMSLGFLLICSAVTFVGAFLFAKGMVSIFTPTGTMVYSLAVHGFYLYAFSYLFKGINIFASSMFTALSDGKTSAILSFLRTLVFIVLGMIFLPRILEVNGIWLAVPFAELLSVFLSLFCFRRQFKLHWRNVITLLPITEENEQNVLQLKLAKGQETFIESTEQCLLEARSDPRWRTAAICADGTVIGFAMYGQFEDGKLNKRVWLDRLFIDRQYQNQGLGLRSLQVMTAHLKQEYGCDELYLSVFPNNEKARRLYENFGFRLNGEHDINGEDVMRLSLKAAYGHMN